MKKIAGALVIIAVVMAACTKDEQKSRVELLTQKEWKLSGLKSTDSQGIEIDFFVNLQLNNNCNLDNILSFGTDGTFTVDEGTNVCNDTSYFFKSGTWVLTPDETKLNIINGNIYYVYTLNEVSENKMVFDAQGNTSSRKSSLKSFAEVVTFRFTFSH